MNNEVTKEMIENLKEDWESESDYINSVIDQTYKMETALINDYISVKDTYDEAMTINWCFLDNTGLAKYYQALAELTSIMKRIEERIDLVKNTRDILKQLDSSASVWIEISKLMKQIV